MNVKHIVLEQNRLIFLDEAMAELRTGNFKLTTYISYSPSFSFSLSLSLLVVLCLIFAGLKI